jgi:hypothetical protein
VADRAYHRDKTNPLKNVLAVYEQMGDTLHWRENHLYGSSRLGMVLPDVKRYPGDGRDSSVKGVKPLKYPYI